jgi:hypothetical protein
MLSDISVVFSQLKKSRSLPASAMKYIFYLFLFILMNACVQDHSVADEQSAMDQLAENYVKLALKIGRYDSDFVDAYYGPDSLKSDTARLAVFPKDSLLKEVNTLADSFRKVSMETKNDTIRSRANWVVKQLIAFERRIKIFSGELAPFDEESKDLFDAVAPTYPETHFKSLVAQLDSVLPGKGPLPERYQKLAANFLIPQDKIDTVFRAAISEARKRTLMRYKLPEEETFVLEYVKDKPWSGYNWYQGNYKSIIQINISQPIFIVRAIDLACHEGYPGHHVYNTLLEKNLYRDKGWTEISLYPLFSPQSLIAEGSANYGIELAFPGDEQKIFCKNVLMPLAGLSPTYSDNYFKAIALLGQLNYARNEVARALGAGKMDEKEALRWLMDYCLLTPKGAADYFRFIKKYRSYVINYNYGQELVKKYIEKNAGKGDISEKRWQLFEQLLSHEFTASDLSVSHD